MKKAMRVTVAVMMIALWAPAVLHGAMVWMDDSEGAANSLDTNGFGWTNGTRTQARPTGTAPSADATGYSLAISANAATTTTAQYTDTTTAYAGMGLAAPDGLDWGNDGSLMAPGNDKNVSGWWIGFYLWANNAATNAHLLKIKLIEEDYSAPNGGRVNDIFKLATAVDMTWTGWRYVMKQLPVIAGGLNDFSDTSESQAGADLSWNPDVKDNTVVAPSTEIAGFKSIQFEFQNNSGSNATIYVDEVTIGQVSGTTGWVKNIYPAADSEDDSIDATLKHLPPTISVRLDTNSNLANSDIFVIEEDPTDASPSYPADGLVDAPNLVRDDGASGLYATPNDTATNGAYAGQSVWTVFVRPADADGDFGKAEVATFKVVSPGTGVKTRYYSVRTD